MRIVVDLQCCQNASRVRGIGRYALAMTRALASIGGEHEWLVVLNDRFPKTIEPIQVHLAGAIEAGSIRVCALPGRIAAAEPASAWRCHVAQIIWTEYLAALNPDLVFVPSFFEGFHDDVAVSLDALSCPVVVTVHDFIPLEEPERYLPTNDDEVAYHRRLRKLRRADLILAISQHTARLAVELARLELARIVVTPNGVDPSFAALAAGAAAGAPARLGISRPFVLNTSPLEHRKNVEGLIAAFALMDRAVRDRHQLVVAGRIDEAGRHHVAALAAAVGLPVDAVVMTGHVAEADLAVLYSTCAVFVFPSFSEGFGLPPLEAMACGAPVISANTTSLPEVIGRRDMLVDPADPAALAAAIERILTDPKWRAELGAYGIERAQRFTWEDAARTALQAFEGLATVSKSALPRSIEEIARVAIVLADQDDAELRHAAATIASLLPPTIEITLAGGGETYDARIEALAERRPLGWFDRHATSMDAIIYMTTALPDTELDQRMSVHPGVVLNLGDQRLEELEPDSTLAAALAAASSGILARVARRLPSSIRGVAPTSDDLARVAVALAADAAAKPPLPGIQP